MYKEERTSKIKSAKPSSKSKLQYPIWINRDREITEARSDKPRDYSILPPNPEMKNTMKNNRLRNQMEMATATTTTRIPKSMIQRFQQHLSSKLSFA